jgi:predicted transposase/invertase (TIGR01784 family)
VHYARPTVHTLLDPTLDVVFKLLFTRGPDSDEALRGLLTAVLDPARPIASIRVLNPAIGGVEVDDKGIALDLLLEFDDGTQLDLEMQARREGGFRDRALFYWAKLFSGQLERGEPYAKLRPAISILFLDYRELPGDRLHSIFHVLEAHDHSRFSEAFEMHVIELPKLDRSPLASGRTSEEALLRWSWFFTDTNEANDPAMSDPAIQKARAVLERLSADPEVRLLAQRRELAQQAHRLELSAVRDEALGHARAAILDLGEAYGVAPTAEQRAALERLDGPGLDALRARLKKERRWP